MFYEGGKNILLFLWLLFIVDVLLLEETLASSHFCNFMQTYFV